jgi:rhamnosyltransferase
MTIETRSGGNVTVRSRQVLNERAASLGTVCAVVPVFYPEASLLESVLRAVSVEVDGIAVVDNSATSQVLSSVKHSWDEANLIVVEAGRNLGVAAAYNRGVALARKGSFTHVLLLDHDSVPRAGMVAELMEALVVLEARGMKVAAVGPQYVDPRTGHWSYAITFGALGFRKRRCEQGKNSNYVRSDFLISSGSLLSLATLDKLGGWDESLFIDHVDTDWFLKARAKGYSAYTVCSAIMEHRLGERVRRIWFGRWRYLPCYPPVRFYYIFRNSLLLYRRSYAPLVWILTDIRRLVWIAALLLAMSPPRGQNLFSVLQGLWDGIKGRGGERVSG